MNRKLREGADGGQPVNELIDQRDTLVRTLADLVVPQRGAAIDLAARVDAQLARGEGDGWRNADLPSDPEAYRTGLDALVGVTAMTAEQRSDLVTAIVAGDPDPEPWHGLAGRRRLEGHQLRGPADATLVRDGGALVTDGPFAETKEQIAGYDILEADSLDELIELVAQSPVAHFGAIELRALRP